MKKIVIALTMSFLLILALYPETVSAYQPDKAYTYDAAPEGGYASAVPSVNVFRTQQIVDENTMGTTRLVQPQDIFVDSRDYVYILDSGNCRVIVLDENYHCVLELKEFLYEGAVTNLEKGAKGLFFHEGSQALYIADTENNRILVTDLEGNVSQIYEKPVAELLDPELSYKPQKIIVDNMGIMYVTSGNVNTGALLIDKDNNFLGFYGINDIKATTKVLVEYAWRKLMTDEQRAQSTESFQPTEFNNLFWSEKRFVYAVSAYNENVESPVVKLNAIGENVFSSTTFGDLGSNSKHVPVFTDITVDSEDVFTILDAASGKLYQYDKECNLLAVFGGLGYQNGLFTMPVSIECNSRNDILVLDATKCNITVMEQTWYGKKIREANELYNAGLYEEAIEPWNEIVRMNANYYLAYAGLGRAYMSMEDYPKAMEYFKLAMMQDEYAEAKAALRADIIRENFALIAAVVIIGMLAILCDDLIKKKIGQLRSRRVKRKGGVRA